MKILEAFPPPPRLRRLQTGGTAGAVPPSAGVAAACGRCRVRSSAWRTVGLEPTNVTRARSTIVVDDVDTAQGPMGSAEILPRAPDEQLAPSDAHPLGFTWNNKRMRTGGEVIKLALAQLRSSGSNADDVLPAEPPAAAASSGRRQSAASTAPYQPTAEVAMPDADVVEAQPVAAAPEAPLEQAGVQEAATTQAAVEAMAVEGAAPEGSTGDGVRRSKRIRRAVSDPAFTREEDEALLAGMEEATSGASPSPPVNITSPGVLAADMLLALCDVAADESHGSPFRGALSDSDPAVDGMQPPQLFMNYQPSSQTKRHASRGGGGGANGYQLYGGEEGTGLAGPPLQLIRSHPVTELHGGGAAAGAGGGQAGAQRGKAQRGQAIPTGARQKTSAYIGVRRRPWGSYAAEIRNQITGSREWLGTFDSAEEAAVVYDLRKRQIKGDGAKCNFPPLDMDVKLVKREICPNGQASATRQTLFIPADWQQQVANFLSPGGAAPVQPSPDPAVLQPHASPGSTAAAGTGAGGLSYLSPSPSPLPAPPAVVAEAGAAAGADAWLPGEADVLDIKGAGEAGQAQPVLMDVAVAAPVKSEPLAAAAGSLGGVVGGGLPPAVDGSLLGAGALAIVAGGAEGLGGAGGERGLALPSEVAFSALQEEQQQPQPPQLLLFSGAAACEGPAAEVKQPWEVAGGPSMQDAFLTVEGGEEGSVAPVPAAAPAAQPAGGAAGAILGGQWQQEALVAASAMAQQAQQGAVVVAPEVVVMLATAAMAKPAQRQSKRHQSLRATKQSLRRRSGQAGSQGGLAAAAGAAVAAEGAAAAEAQEGREGEVLAAAS